MKQYLGMIYILLIFFTMGFGQDNSLKFHWDYPLNCSECHSCEKPTHQEPCLKLMPTFKRPAGANMHSLKEAPPEITIDVLSNKFGPVKFNHGKHAAHAMMQKGCETCHHHNPGDKIVPCSQCHQPGTPTANSNKPTLKGALHQQCIGCHKTWDKSWQDRTDCSSCHEPKEGTKVPKTSIVERNKLTLPEKLLFKSDYEEGPLVTFHHAYHITGFGITCETCHQEQNCKSCHGEHEKVEVAHDNCVSCHEADIDENCQKCHGEKEKPGFNHAKIAGWKLNAKHKTLQCSACHGSSGKITRHTVKCISCHKDFSSGKFNHAKTGLKLNEVHAELDCTDCHTSGNFIRQPSCNDCHDDFKYPEQKPGKLVLVK